MQKYVTLCVTAKEKDYCVHFNSNKQMMGNKEQGSIVTLLCDSGERYLDTYYNDDWVSENIGELSVYKEQLDRLM